ncbi:AraC family transcriptional regulator [Jiangella asiatica]|uniref:AraC family transcriptional regulator n=1 Tax=Jiangella asiatica TaxID=2530372 RepID=A0A4R5DM20_9ACTN|nr:AraC family transcriptional regulator [Jiangella asiatica]TDE13090.1 AraC family transcriptional regulator [Jiangella asiatica]
MDPLTALLDAPRARGAFLLRVTMTPPWAVRVQDEAPLSVVAVTAGSTWFVPDDGDPVRLLAGDLLLIARPDPYLFADAVARPPQAVINSDGRCETPAGTNLELPTYHGVRTWGNAPMGCDAMLVGTYPSVSEVGSRLLRALPPTLLMRAADHRSGLIEVLADEINGEGIGQASLLDRLLDGLTVAAIRHWANFSAADPPGWLRAGTDPIVGAALDLMHDQPAQPWTVASLAQRVGMSRAGFSRRFVASVGEPPMAYLTSWRLALAADRLRQDSVPVFRVAAEVGYTSPFTFSTAFKRHYGVSPLTYRQQGAVPA